MKTNSIIKSLLLTSILSFFLFSFVVDQNISGNGEILSNNKPSTTTGGGGVFSPNKTFRDRVYDNENTPNRRPIKYTNLRQADVAKEKRVWRKLDLKEKLNLPLMYPDVDSGVNQNRESFFVILRNAILAGKISFFKDDEFRQPFLSKDEVAKELRKPLDSIKQLDMSGNDSVDANNNVVYKLLPPTDYSTKDVLSLSIKEDWYFDKQRSVWDVRILGICLNINKLVKGAAYTVPVGWVYYEDCREIFARKEVYNPKNDSERRTLDDFFWKRMFSSYITRESNVFERSVSDFTVGLDAMLEADRIKSDMYKWESEIWHY